MAFFALDSSFMLKPVQEIELLFPYWNPGTVKRQAWGLGFFKQVMMKASQINNFSFW